VSQITLKHLGFIVAVVGLSFAGSSCARESAPPAEQKVAGPAPDSFRAIFETSRGAFTVEISRAWAPRGADRFYELAKTGFFDDQRFFRVVPEFIAQFGLSNDRKLNERWDEKPLADDSVRQTNARGTLTFATQGPNSRTHQLFLNLSDNGRLDGMGFAPIGRVVEGMAVVDSLYNGYGESPNQTMIQSLGASYLRRNFPNLDYIKGVRVVEK
jgi:peptidyl-prolyl cis-trans isomerase A (cyclophilin A)